jgi:nitronate monooxygenase
MFLDQRLLELFKISIPLIQAPMAGAADAKLAIAVSKAGGLGSIACPLLSVDQIRKEVHFFRKESPGKPLNLNFFCHTEQTLTEEQESQWRKVLKPYFEELKINEDQNVSSPQRNPFNEETCKLVEELKPEVISFHFGLPPDHLLKRVKNIGSKIISSATTPEEARWLEAKGCDAIIAQGFEAGGHRGSFLTKDISTQIGTMALVPLIVDSVKVPVIAAGGIADGRGMAAALILGASAVQIGTAFLFTHEAIISSVHRQILLSKRSEETALTNLFTGKPARGIVNRIMREIGPMSTFTPPFPYAGKDLAPLKAATEKHGSDDFMSLWSGQAAGLIKEIISAEELTKKISEDALKIFTK